MNFKRMAFAATAIVAIGVPMAAPAFADPPRQHRYDDRHDRRDYRDDRRDDRRNDRWRVGDRYDRYDDHRYREVDYRNHRLKAPPRGYHYVRDDNTGEIILAVIATGIIAAIIAN